MSAVYLLPTLRQEKSVPEEIFSDTPKQIHYLSYTLSHFTNPNRTLFIPNPSGALLRRKRNAKGNAASGRIGECRGVRLGSATLTFMSEAPPATRRFPNLEPLCGIYLVGVASQRLPVLQPIHQFCHDTVQHWIEYWNGIPIWITGQHQTLQRA